MASSDLKMALSALKAVANKSAVQGYAKFGISTKNAIGVSIPDIRKIAKNLGKDSRLAEELWNSKLHEARLLAPLVIDPALVTERQMDKWANDLNSWNVCDQCCGNLFDKTPFARKKAIEWSKQKKEYVKRAGFVLMAALAVHDKTLDDAIFIRFLPIIEREAYDERNFVKKAVNWALRQIGKRNTHLNRCALDSAMRIRAQGSKSAKWIASDAIRELTSESVKRRLND